MDFLFDGIDVAAVAQPNTLQAQLSSYRAAAVADRRSDAWRGGATEAQSIQICIHMCSACFLSKPQRWLQSDRSRGLGLFFDDSCASMDEHTLSDYIFIYSNNPFWKRSVISSNNAGSA